MNITFIPLYLVATLSAQPVSVDGTALEAALNEGIIEFTKDGKGPTADALIASMKEIPIILTLLIPEAAKTNTPEASICILPLGSPAAIGDEMKVNNHPRLSCL